MVGQQFKSHFLHPSASCNLVAIVFEGNVKKYRGLEFGSVAVVSEVQVEVKRIFCEGTQTQR